MSHITAPNTIKTHTAVAIRDAALRILDQHGEWTATGNASGTVKHKVLTASVGAFEMSLHVPQGPSERDKYFAAAHDIVIPEQLPFGLDIWHGPKVLSIHWSDDKGTVRIINFKRGQWEMEFLSLAAPQSVAA